MKGRIIVVGILAAMVMSLPETVCGDETGVRLSANRADTKITITAKDKVTTVNIVSPFGIDNATLHRTGERWPDSMVISLHLKGLESFTAGSGQVEVVASVPSTGEPIGRLSLRQGGTESALDKSSPFWTDVRMIGGNGKIPLAGGRFEIRLPAKLFEANPPSIQLRWIDFYRN